MQTTESHTHTCKPKLKIEKRYAERKARLSENEKKQLLQLAENERENEW